MVLAIHDVRKAATGKILRVYGPACMVILRASVDIEAMLGFVFPGPLT
jgi:hypothetical protein